MVGDEDRAGRGPGEIAEPRIELLGQATVAVSGETHRLVTFLNQTLKDHDFIFGLTRASEGGATISVYRVVGGKPGRPDLRE